MRFDAVQILGKELRRDPERALRELRARSAAASVALRRGARFALSLEAPLRGQREAGSQIVARLLAELGVPEQVILLDETTRSTREEALHGCRWAEQRGWGRVLVVTTAYHVPRARRQFEEAFGPGRVAVHAPEALLRGATPLERRWIEAGSPTADAFRAELAIEALLANLARGVSLLPSRLRWELEVRAGAALRGIDDRRAAKEGAARDDAAREKKTRRSG